MKAAILEAKGVIAYRDVPQPTPEPSHVLLAVHAASICGSDISRYAKGHRLYPLILGHEVAGIVTAVGAGVSPDLIGKHAAIIPLVPCFHCEECARGYYSACHSYSFIGSRQSGGFADYVEIPQRNALILPDDLPFEAAALIEPSTVARHILDLGGFQAGQSAIVLGVGSIGLMVIQWLRILQASLIICTDISDDNLAVARKLGAHVTLNPKTVDVVAEVRRLAGDGVDLAIEAAGAPQTLLQTVQVARPRGSVVFGGNQPLDQTLPMQFIEDVMRKELRLNGCFMSYSAPFPGHEWTETVEAIQSGALDTATMISHRYPLSAAPQVFAQIAAHQLPHQKIILFPEKPAMTLCNPLPWIQRAQRESFVIGAFNANTFEQLQAIVRAAQVEAAPVVQVSHRALQYIGSGSESLGLRYVAASSISAPVAKRIRFFGASGKANQ